MAKITIQFASVLYEAFASYVKASGLQRDAFVEGILEAELRRLDRAMNGKAPLSDKARRYVAKSLRSWAEKLHANRQSRPKDSDSKAMVLVNMTISDEIAEQLQRRIDESHMCRDAFFNRLLLLLVGSPRILKWITEPQVDDEDQGSIELPDQSEPISPMKAIRDLLRDPLRDLHDHAQRHWKNNLWEIVFPEEWHGLSCWIEPHNVPGTQEAKKLKHAVKRILRDPEALVRDFERALERK
ncbi:MAG: hypothetical protein JNL04_01690 [Rhodospirillaceae bacterium]|nr:hypothetical protein [Rhodospirillaceae bacterium]